MGGPKGPMCVWVWVWVWVGGGGSRLSANLPAPGSRRPPAAAHLASVRIPERPLWRPQRPLWRPQRPLWRPERLLWRPQRRLWRPKNEDSSIKMKRFGSNLFNLMELSSFFGRNRVPGGFQGVPGCAGSRRDDFRPQNSAGKNRNGAESAS